MVDLRNRFISFPWIPSFVVSILSGLVFLIIENPRYIPQSWKAVIRLIFEYSITAVAVGAFIAGCISLFFSLQQKLRWNKLESRLESKVEAEKEAGNDITKSATKLLIEWIDRVDGLLWISEDGEVTITGKDLNDAQKVILYLIGIRYAFELELLDSPEVPGGEIAEKTQVPYMSVRGWYLPLEDVIEKRHLELWERFEEGPFDKYQLNIESVDKAFHHVTGDEDLPEPLY